MELTDPLYLFIMQRQIELYLMADDEEDRELQQEIVEDIKETFNELSPALQKEIISRYEQKRAFHQVCLN